MSFEYTQFSREEWEHCIKVLTALKDDPFANPDNQLFSTLVTSISKQARKQIRHTRRKDYRNEEMEIMNNTVIHSMALSGTTLYHDLPKEQQFTRLKHPRNCYCCAQPYYQVHSFYARLCPDCAHTNYRHRFTTADLHNRVALLTGGRVKVGYATALRLLRNQATVIVTTRFPGLAFEQFRQEEDYAAWQDRLTVYGLDLRNLHAVQTFAEYVKAHFGKLDILINNAAQTIRYTDAYYQPVIAAEQQARLALAGEPRLIENTTPVTQELHTWPEIPVAMGNISLNRFGQPVDEREKNSWNSMLEEISLPELLEVNLINHISPYLLIKELKPLMLQSEFTERYIINVTSSEGIFSYHHKTPHHPHTNMTKAALNMLTRTSASAMKPEGIHMCCVDVGWISTGARESLRKIQFEEAYIPPLDPVDGASRIFHPIVSGMEGQVYSGVLLKNYVISEW